MPPNKTSLIEEYRLIERSEHEVNGAWKGAHILLFFLSFVFGSFCTFCFHMLMYMFDEKCVLFPKLQSLTSLRHNVIYEFIPLDKDAADMPVDFLSTQWVEKSRCYLPTYVPLVSGIFGLVWTTMFLMCSTGSRTLTGLQRPWRILPSVFLFSLAMSALCIYSSAITHNGLQELCLKLSEITGSPTCTYTVNVATLVYERRIRGVYQATRLTIMSAWLHTTCWILSAILALVRVIMVVDFQLVRVNVDLIGDIDKMLENQETQIRSVSPDRMIYAGTSLTSSATSNDTYKVKFKGNPGNMDNDTTMMYMLYYDDKGLSTMKSAVSLIPEERHKLIRNQIFESVDKEHKFIAEMVFDLVDNLDLPESSAMDSPPSLVVEVVRQYGQSKIKSLPVQYPHSQRFNAEQKLTKNYNTADKSNVVELKTSNISEEMSSSWKESVDNITENWKQRIRETIHSRERSNTLEKTQDSMKKSNLKNVSIQTDRRRKRVAARRSIKHKVKISEPKMGTSSSRESSEISDKSNDKNNKESQTPKEKQD